MTKDVGKRMDEIDALLREFGATLSGYDPGVTARFLEEAKNPRALGYDGSGAFGEPLSFSRAAWAWLEPLLVELREARKGRSQGSSEAPKEPPPKPRTYCCYAGCAMDGDPRDCKECSGRGRHREVPAGWCGHAVSCALNDSHAHYCELAPGHEGRCASPGALAAKECAPKDSVVERGWTYSNPEVAK